MGYCSQVAFSFTEENWDKVCELAKTDTMANNKNWPFDDLVKYADMNKEVEGSDGKRRILLWRSIKWYTECKDSINFFDKVARPLANEYMRIGEEIGDVDAECHADDAFFSVDGNEIDIYGITMTSYQKDYMLPDIVKAFIEAAPDAARKWKEERGDKYYGGSEEFENMFQPLYPKED